MGACIEKPHTVGGTGGSSRTDEVLPPSRQDDRSQPPTGSMASQSHPPTDSMTNQSNNAGTNFKAKTGSSFMDKALNKAADKASAKLEKTTGKSMDAWVQKGKDKLEKATDMLEFHTNDFKKQLVENMDKALANVDNHNINKLLDSAIANRLITDSSAPAELKRAASTVSSRQLKHALESGDPKQLKGAMIAAWRLNCHGLPEFQQAAAKYHEVRQLPAGWDVSKMVLNRDGGKMVAKMKVEDEAIKAKFQYLLDATHEKKYTRDRMGQAIPERLELVSVRAITNADVWGDYMARRETIRREIEADGADFERYDVDTINTRTDLGDSPAASSSAAAVDSSLTVESVAAALADDFAEPLLSDVNEVFLFHGTKQEAAEKITTGNVRVNLAGSNAGTLYGRGVYFAESSTKSDEYTWPVKELRQLLVCRVVLGRVYYSDTKETDARACEAACVGGKFHSVLGDRRKCRGTFREFVLFDEEQVYPNYIIEYRRKEKPMDPDRSVQVKCPKGQGPGSTCFFNTPDGKKMSVIVPVNVKAGQTFTVMY